jgi:hypothetical protein
VSVISARYLVYLTESIENREKSREYVEPLSNVIILMSLSFLITYSPSYPALSGSHSTSHPITFATVSMLNS